MIGDGFDHVSVRLTLTERICERVRNYVQVLAAAYNDASEVAWTGGGEDIGAAALAERGLDHAAKRELAHAIGYINGAAMAVDLTPIELLELCGATW